jgi:putative redox protein
VSTRELAFSAALEHRRSSTRRVEDGQGNSVTAYNMHLFRREFRMECTVRWTGLSGMSFVAETGSGHLVTMDGAPEGGGRNLAPRPMEVVLAGTGGCTAYDVVVILRKSGQDIRGCDLTLTSERAEKDPKVFTKVHFHFIVRGRHLKANLVERAIKLSHEKYCSASIMMEKTAELTHSFEIIDDLADAPIQSPGA